MNDEVEDKEDAKAQRQEATEGQGKALVPLQERRINFHGDELVVVLVERERASDLCPCPAILRLFGAELVCAVPTYRA